MLCPGPINIYNFNFNFENKQSYYIDFQIFFELYVLTNCIFLSFFLSFFLSCKNDLVSVGKWKSLIWTGEPVYGQADLIKSDTN